MSSSSSFCAYDRTIDLVNPRNVKLSAFFRRSSGFRCVKDRWPIVLRKVIDSLSQNKDSISREYGNEAAEEIETVIGKISKLNYEIQSNKPLKVFTLHSSDACIYNELIRERFIQDGTPKPYHSNLLLVECYMYRKIWESFEATKHLKKFDPYRISKKNLFATALTHIKETMVFLQEILNYPEMNQENFCSLLEMNLWSNKCDLLLNPEGVVPIFIKEIRGLSNNILVNDSKKVWNALCSSEPGTVDIVLDNAGKELLTELCLAHFLQENNICKKINFHVKNLPWFLSDVMSYDIKWMLEQFIKSDDKLFKTFGENWIKKFENNEWEIKHSNFWTLPTEFEMMHKYDRKLYQDLSKSQMIIFKGDLNYRKLFRDYNWAPDTPVSVAKGLFGPSKFCSIRTVKSEIICGIPEKVANELDQKDPIWMETGNYGVIQYSDNIIPLLSENEISNKNILH